MIKRNNKKNHDTIDSMIDIDTDSNKSSSDISSEIAEKELRSARAKNGLRNVLTIGIMMLIVILIRLFVVTPFVIPSESMEDTILVGDYVLSESCSYWTGSPQQGDIVTFKDPEAQDSKHARTLIKRVIATEGQVVTLKDGKVYVNGNQLDEKYVDNKPTLPLQEASGIDIDYPYKVPAGCVWVMGDNRTDSADSRYFGPVRIDLITGKAFYRYFPFDRIGILH